MGMLGTRISAAHYLASLPGPAGVLCLGLVRRGPFQLSMHPPRLGRRQPGPEGLVGWAWRQAVYGS